MKSPVTLSSTSNRTATSERINLTEPTRRLRLYFEPTVVKNPKEPENAVEGTLVYERKSANDEHFPTDVEQNPNTRKNTRNGDALTLNLNTSETRALYLGLQKLYELNDSIDQMPFGTASYIKVDNAARTLLELLRNDPSAARMIGDADTFDLVKELLKLLTQGSTRTELQQVLSGLDQSNIQELETGLNLRQLIMVQSLMRSNLDNGSEEFWQSQVFAAYPWIISQVFSTPCTLLAEKAYVGGKSLDNTGGNVADFIYRNQTTANVAIVEIKTPKTKILGRRYRNHVCCMSDELSGAIGQVLDYRQKLLTELAQLKMNSPAKLEAFSPKCVIIIGNTEEFNGGDLSYSDRLSSFEHFRNSLNGVTVITFDELLQRISDLIDILRDDLHQAAPKEEEPPF